MGKNETAPRKLPKLQIDDLNEVVGGRKKKGHGHQRDNLPASWTNNVPNSWPTTPGGAQTNWLSCGHHTASPINRS